ncbi:uncharacterized protein LOC124153271 [Ischnura elegans]|uniref:uncharacterized protein LOC124153271 n=1 Tax=Ischnura elegans TaxID=197161 RepID=UPI001ED8A2F3|nr:uncharacterized protein LOC124153271 [Ischnura elegans]
MPDPPASQPGADRIAVRAPPFWPEEPSLWFSQLEGQFYLAGVKEDETKFWFVVSQLDHRYAQEVKDIISCPPTSDKYNTLKSELIKRLSASQEHKLKLLLEHEEMGDRKPSQFLRHLRDLAGNSVTDDFLRSLWLSRLPSHLHAILAAHDAPDLNALGSLADRINEVVPRATPPPSLSVSEVTPTSQTCAAGCSQIMASLIARMDELTRQVGALSVSGHPHYRRHRSRSRSRKGASRPTSPGPRDPNVCWYHWRFGKDAHKCIPPCSYTPENIPGRL